MTAAARQPVGSGIPLELQKVGRHRLDLLIPVLFGTTLWRKQREIARAMSQRNARVAVRSSNASGKSHVAPAIALAFFVAYGPHAKVITTSGTKEDQLKFVFWGELRRHLARARLTVPGRIPPSAMELIHTPEHYILGQVPSAQESMRGHHGPHVMVVVDEATAVTDEFGSALLSLMTTSDVRLLLLFNPTTPDTWAARQDFSEAVTSIPIRAWDTPTLSHFTAEQIFERWGAEVENHTPIVQPIPPGADLLAPDFLDYMVANGEGPGSLEWQQKIEAEYWQAGSNTLVAHHLYDLATQNEVRDGPVSFGIDLGLWGDSESVIAIRKGNRLVSMIVRSGMLPEDFWTDTVEKAVRDWQPSTVVFDADGVGAGTIKLARRIVGDARLFPFRGSHPLGTQWANARSMWWWRLKQRFEAGDIVLDRVDTTLRRQVLAMTWKPNARGLVQAESKRDLRHRGIHHLDRGDAVCLAFGHDAVYQRLPADDPALVSVAPEPNPSEMFGRELRKARAKPRVTRTMSGIQMGRRR